MSSATSPPPSLVIQTPSSARSSVSLDPPASKQQLSQANRRNRSALRDYYNLAAAANNAEDSSRTASSAPTPPPEPQSPVDVFDSPSFDAQAYVNDVLAKEDLAGILRVETGLVSRIRGLDGERKALVYDNYNKLIAATETIRRMRGNMDPLAPMTKTLEPAVEQIVTKAEIMSDALKPRQEAERQRLENGATKQKQVRTVRWALDAPSRVEEMVKQGRREEAEQEWEKVKKLLNSWVGIKGVEELRERGDALLGIE